MAHSHPPDPCEWTGVRRSQVPLGCSNTEPAPTPETPDSDASRISCNVRVPEDAGSLQEAVDRVRDGATICLGDGVFDGNLALHDRDLAIQGTGMGRTILQGDGTDSALYLMGSDVELRGLTITGGVAEQGGGIHVHDSDLRLEGVEVTGNTASMDGGGGAGGSGSGPEDRCPPARSALPEESQRPSQQCCEERGPDRSHFGQGLDVFVVDVLLHPQASMPLRFNDHAPRTDAGERVLGDEIEGRSVQA